MSSRRSNFPILSILFACLTSVAAPLSAQDVSTLPVDQRQADLAPTTPAGTPETTAVTPLDYSSAYPGPSLSTIASERKALFHSSFALSSGYDTAIDDVARRNGPIALAEVTAGVLINRHRYSLLLEHDAKFTGSFHSGTDLKQYQQTTAAFTRVFSRRTNWSALLQNEFGADVARSLGRLTGSPLNSVVTDPSSNATGLTAGNTLSVHGLTSMEHRFSLFPVLSLDAGAYYHRFVDLGTSSHEQYAAVAFRQVLSQRSIAGVKLSAVRETYAGANCVTAAADLFGSTQFHENVHLEASAGPAWSSAGCVGKYQYEVLLSRDTPRGVLLYLSSSERRSDGLAPGSTWENAHFGGIVFGQQKRFEVRGDAGYTRYKVFKVTAATPDLNGYFLSGELRHRLSDWSEFSLTGRFFSRSATAYSFNRCVLLATYTWSRQQRPASMQTMERRNGHQ